MEDPSSQNLLLQFVLLFILTVLNAFFSATEMAMVHLTVRGLNKRQKKEIDAISVC